LDTFAGAVFRLAGKALFLGMAAPCQGKATQSGNRKTVLANV